MNLKECQKKTADKLIKKIKMELFKKSIKTVKFKTKRE